MLLFNIITSRGLELSQSLIPLYGQLLGRVIWMNVQDENEDNSVSFLSMCMYICVFIIGQVCEDV